MTARISVIAMVVASDRKAWGKNGWSGPILCWSLMDDIEFVFKENWALEVKTDFSHGCILFRNFRIKKKPKTILFPFFSKSVNLENNFQVCLYHIRYVHRRDLWRSSCPSPSHVGPPGATCPGLQPNGFGLSRDGDSITSLGSLHFAVWQQSIYLVDAPEDENKIPWN